MGLAYDLSVYYSGITTHSLADVMGYFYPANPEADWSAGNGPIAYTDETIHVFGPYATITTTTSNQEVMWAGH